MLAVAVTLATPDALVTAVMFDGVALAPVVGDAKVTVAPLTGSPNWSFTVACRAVRKAFPTPADWGVPAVDVILAGGPAVLVNENVAVTP